MWENLSKEDRLKITEYIFSEITREPSPSFRRLIYDRLGFGANAYESLYLSGGMFITNSISEKKDEKDY